MAANTRLLRRRIRTAKNIAQITKAMEMVAVSKMRRAQEKTTAGKPYAQHLRQLVANLTGRVENGSHPYLLARGEGETLLILVSPDKGLCGSLATNLVRELLRFKATLKGNLDVIAVGRKLASKTKRIGTNLVADFPFGTSVPPFETVFPIAILLTDGFLKGTYKEVLVLYTHFASMGLGIPTIFRLLPIEKKITEGEAVAFPYHFEPDASSLLTALMPHYIEMSLYQILLEAYASEQSARRLAMHQASENAKDIIWELTLYYNKVRQERITNELLDIVGGGVGDFV